MATALPTIQGEQAPAGSAPHRALFLSDVHLGTGRTEARRLLQQLQAHPSERLVLVGDILDCTAWQRRGAVFSPDEVELLLWLVAAGAARQVIWVLGNHEHPLQRAMGSDVMRTVKEGGPGSGSATATFTRPGTGSGWRSSMGIAWGTVRAAGSGWTIGATESWLPWNAGAAAWGCPAPPWRCSRGDGGSR